MAGFSNKITCPLCGQDVECRITVTTSGDPTGEALLRMNLRLDEEPLRAHVDEVHSPTVRGCR